MDDKCIISVVILPLAILIYVVFFSLLSSCTYNISMVHTEGSASDVIDETNENTPTISPKIGLPVI